MLTKSEALDLVSERLREMSPPDDSFVVVDAKTIEKPFGWAFFYNSRKFLDTGEFSYRLAGNGPVIVDRDSGHVEFFGAYRPVLEIISDYEKPWTDQRNR